MKNLGLIVCALAIAASANAAMYVDTAPNASGSSNWAPWWAAAKTDIAAGMFTNMRSGLFPGQLKTDPIEAIVYSTMDLGHRLHFIYYLPGMSKAQLTGNFELKLQIDWDGYPYALDWNTGGWLDDGANVGWSTPNSWEDFNGGVIGSFGLGWWAADNDASPQSTNSNAYDETDMADVQSWVDMLHAAQTYTAGQIRYRASANDAWTYESLSLVNVPEPATMCLLGLGGLLLTRKRK